MVIRLPADWTSEKSWFESGRGKLKRVFSSLRHSRTSEESWFESGRGKKEVSLL
jgi:hypothetical protein